MDIQKFQQKLTEACELGEKNGKVLKPAQIKECFGELDLDKSQLIKILQYLKLKGITIEGAEVLSAAPQEEHEEESAQSEEKVPLTPEEEVYLKEYLEGLEEQEQGTRSAEELFALLSQGDTMAQAELSQKYLRAAAEMAVEMNCEEIFIADLIQEANISLLMALGEEGAAGRMKTGCLDVSVREYAMRSKNRHRESLKTIIWWQRLRNWNQRYVSSQKVTMMKVLSSA